MSRDCVPVALNLYTIRAAKGPAGDFFRGVQKQRPAMYQGVYLVSADGTVLSGQGRQPAGKSWTADLLDVIDDGMKAFGPVAPRQVQRGLAYQYRGRGVREDGSITLAVSTRWMLLGTDRRGLGALTLDRIDLAKDAAEGLGPKVRARGWEWGVPEELVRKMHVALAADSDRSAMPRANELSRAWLEGRVERVGGGVAYLSYEGRLTGAHTGEFDPSKGKKAHSELRLFGVGTCEAKTGRLLSITLLGKGKARGFPPYDQEREYGAVIEWRK